MANAESFQVYYIKSKYWAEFYVFGYLQIHFNELIAINSESLTPIPPYFSITFQNNFACISYFIWENSKKIPRKFHKISFAP